MYERLGQDEGHLRTAISLLERPLRHLKRKRVTFLCGDAGPLAVAAVIYDKLCNKDKSQDCIKRYNKYYYISIFFILEEVLLLGLIFSNIFFLFVG